MKPRDRQPSATAIVSEREPSASARRWTPTLSQIACALILLAFAALFIAGARAAEKDAPANATDQSAVQVRVDASSAGPRELEDTTVSSIQRAYARAWQMMAGALEENRSDQLDVAFLGYARDNLAQRVADQQKLGMRTRIIDHGHKVDIVFYSPEGMSMQLRDTAQLELQVLDGGNVVHSENVTKHYLAVLTPTEVTWKVRVLQEEP